MERTLLAIVLATGSLWAGSQFVRLWQGDDLPGAALTVTEDQGKLSGSIVFYLTRKDDIGARAGDEAHCELLRVAVAGRRMTFEVKHHVRHGGPEYGPNLKFLFELAGDAEGMLRNIPNGVSIRMVREP